MKKYISTSFIACLSFYTATSADESFVIEENQKLKPCTATISASFIGGNGIGYTNGYLSLDGVLFPTTSLEKSFPFLDVRGHVFKNEEYAANAGIGFSHRPFS